MGKASKCDCEREPVECFDCYRSRRKASESEVLSTLRAEGYTGPQFRVMGKISEELKVEPRASALVLAQRVLERLG